MTNNYSSNYKAVVSYLVLFFILLSVRFMSAQSLAGSTWDLASTTGASGYTNWGSGVISLTDTVTGVGSCQGAAVTETGSGYNPTSGAVFSRCFSVFFGCPGNDQIGTSGNPYTDQNGDGLAFSFWKTGGGTYNVNNGNTCGGGLGYHNALSGGPDNKMITIEFDTYSSIGTDVDGEYGGGAPGSGINDEIAIHRDMWSQEDFLVYDHPTPGMQGSSFNAGNLEDGLVHRVCISYTPATRRMVVTIDGVTRVDYDMGATYNLQDYFGNNALNYTWSAGKYGATNMQTIGPDGTSLVGEIGHVFCPGQTMPVDYISLFASRKESSVLLNWSTATESGNAKFVVERSVNGADWQTIGEVEGAGNSSSVLNYQYEDVEPLSGTAYYRIRQVDQDGTFSYSKVLAVSAVPNIAIVPNPFEDKITVSGEADFIEITDVLGRVVYAHQTTSSETVIAPDLEPGMYWITVQSESFVERRQIVRK